MLCEAQRRVEMGLLSGEISHAAALSLDGLACGLQALVSIGAIHRIRRCVLPKSWMQFKL